MKVEKTVASVARNPIMYGARMYTILSTIAKLGQQFTGSDKKTLHALIAILSYLKVVSMSSLISSRRMK